MSGRDDASSGRRRRRGKRGGASRRREEPAEKADPRDKSRGGEAVFGFRKTGVGKSGIPRLRWNPPKLNTGPLPEPDCYYCGKPIRDIGEAIQDKVSRQPVHFDCALTRLAESETMESGDVIAYIGGGRFGIVHFNERFTENRAANGAASRGRAVSAEPGWPVSDAPGRIFTIKKTFEWENKEERPDWRTAVADHYSLT